MKVHPYRPEATLACKHVSKQGAATAESSLVLHREVTGEVLLLTHSCQHPQAERDTFPSKTSAGSNWAGEPSQHRTSSFFLLLYPFPPFFRATEAGREPSGACGPRRARGTPLSHHGGRAARGGVPLPRLRLAAGRLMAGGGGEEVKPDRPVAQRRDSLASAGGAALARRRRG